MEFPGTYTVSGSTINLTIDTSSLNGLQATGTATVSGDTLTWVTDEGTAVFTKQ